MKTPVVCRPFYTVYLEDYQGNTFIHCDCFKWTKGVKKQLTEDIDVLTKLHGKPLLAFHDKDDNKHWKFLTMLGFKFFSDVHTQVGIKQLFIRSA